MGATGHHAMLLFVFNLLYARHEAGAEKSYSQRRREMQSQMKFDGMQLLDPNGSWKPSRVKESNPAQHLGELSHLAQDRTWKPMARALSCNPDRPFARQSHAASDTAANLDGASRLHFILLAAGLGTLGSTGNPIRLPQR